MIFYGNVVVRKGNKYWIGTIDGVTFTPTEEIKNIDELKSTGVKLITIYDYSTFIGMDYSKKKLDDIRKQIGYSEVWIIDDESPKPNSSNSVSDVIWKKWYFKFIHPMCQKCVKGCKQSSRVGVFCNQFEEKK
jgi:hypothetical protein